MGGREVVRLSPFAVSCALAPIGIDRSNSGLSHGCRRTANEHHHAAKRGAKTRNHQGISPHWPPAKRGLIKQRRAIWRRNLGYFSESSVPLRAFGRTLTLMTQRSLLWRGATPSGQIDRLLALRYLHRRLQSMIKVAL